MRRRAIAIDKGWKKATAESSIDCGRLAKCLNRGIRSAPLKSAINRERMAACAKYTSMPSAARLQQLLQQQLRPARRGETPESVRLDSGGTNRRMPIWRS